MLTLVETSTGFAAIQRAVKPNDTWPGPEADTKRLAGPITLDVYQETRAEDELIQCLVAEAERAGILLNGWGEQEVRAFRSAVWRSAHRFVVDHISLVDRGPELDELAAILKVSRD